MPPVVVPVHSLARLRAFVLDRDKLALMVGVATIEWRQRVESIERSIARNQAEQRAYGEDVLRGVGLDPAAGEYRIDDETGIVTELVAGAWGPVQR